MRRKADEDWLRRRARWCLVTGQHPDVYDQLSAYEHDLWTDEYNHLVKG